MRKKIGETIMTNDEFANDPIREAIKQKIKAKIKKELLKEIYSELKLEEEITDEITTEIINEPLLKHSDINKINLEPISMEFLETSASNGKIEASITINVKSILKIASHALKYAHSKIPKESWVEVIGLLAGKFDHIHNVLHIEDVYPMGHGNAVYAEIKDYKNYVRAFKEIKKNNLFICGWYHSHPSYGCFMSREDLGTQSRYQTLWEKAVALVIDPYQINGKSLGFEIYRADFKKREWFSVPFEIKGNLDVRMLPEILDFMNPIIEGKAAYLEYDK